MSVGMLTADLARGKLTNVPLQQSAGIQITRHRVAANQSPDISTYLHIYTLATAKLYPATRHQGERDIERCVECVGS